MKPENISDAMGYIEDELVVSAGESRNRKNNKKKRPHIRPGLAAVAACICLAAAGIFWSGLVFIPNEDAANGGSEKEFSAREDVTNSSAADESSAQVKILAKAQYPEMIQCPDMETFTNEITGEVDDEAYMKEYDAWWESRKKQLSGQEDRESLKNFVYQTQQQFLKTEDGKNSVYSPLNIYMALGMLAEVTDGNSREQILELLGTEDMDVLRDMITSIWNSNYCDDGVVTSILANSLWLNEDIDFVQSTLDTLKDVYYASSYQGTMGSDEMNRELQNWLNEQTGDLLKDQAGKIELDSTTVMALASAVYFKAGWSDEFFESNTKEGIFHSGQGDVKCDFMNQTLFDYYYRGEHFSAIRKGLHDREGMWLILPDEGTQVEELLEDRELLELYFSGGEWENSEYKEINLSMPRFDVSSDMDLSQGLQALGITDVFDMEKSDFTPMTRDTDKIYLSRSSHAARVMVDEEGCTAAAFTVVSLEAGEGWSGDKVDFVLDRPFLFVIEGIGGDPLFAGVVNQPEN
ncbi:MAG: serpin family protein [Lachnospiraceae bacterium]|nr:serpin family protein [Lachnospiraceae bacterium]